MRILVHNVDTYLGRTLVKELRKAEGGFHRIFGTVAHDASKAPKVVKRLVSREDPKKAKKMAETMQSCSLVILDLFHSSLEDLHFAISALKVDPKSNPPKPTGDLDGPVTFILISSVLVWAATPVESEDGTLQDSDYRRRMPVPGSKYEQWKEMEELVFSCFNREGSAVRGFVVAGGVLYGEGEATFGQHFKDAWRGVQEHTIIAPGTNRLPTVHVRDLARMVRQLGQHSESYSPMESTPYLLAVDQPPAGQDKSPMPSTQVEIVQGIVDEVGEHYAVPVTGPPKATGDDKLQEVLEAMTLDLRVQPSAMMLDHEFASASDPPGWWCKDGFLANIRTVADEFCREWQLRAIRVLIAGPPASGKRTLAKAISEHFRIPHLTLESEVPEEIGRKLGSTVCRYRGYVLDAGLVGFEEVERLFRYDLELPPPEPADDAADDQEPPPKQVERRLNEELCPAFVIVTQAPAAFCRARWQAGGYGPLEDFQERVQRYTEANLTDGVHSLADFFQDVAGIGVFNLPVAGKDEEDIFESARIYVERSGRPFNYLPTGDEVAAEILARQAEKESAALAERAAAEAVRSAGDDAGLREERLRQVERLQIVARHQEEQRALHDLSLREYLMRYMVPSLTEGLIEVCKVLPDNPVDYLATYLEEHAADPPVART